MTDPHCVFVLILFCAITFGLHYIFSKAFTGNYFPKSSSSRSSDGNSSLPDEGGSASQVPQAISQSEGVYIFLFWNK